MNYRILCFVIFLITTPFSINEDVEGKVGCEIQGIEFDHWNVQLHAHGLLFDSIYALDVIEDRFVLMHSGFFPLIKR